METDAPAAGREAKESPDLAPRVPQILGAGLDRHTQSLPMPRPQRHPRVRDPRPGPLPRRSSDRRRYAHGPKIHRAPDPGNRLAIPLRPSPILMCFSLRATMSR
ncbi:hypothetical protein ZWY2020_017571 [Hordeum vulgare]|nr:hypothetical protein ZWY2020_017571 [Hordeum vulgare]